MSELQLAAIYRTKSGEDRCLVIGGRADMLAGRPGSTGVAIAEADPEFDAQERFYVLWLDKSDSLRNMEPASCQDGRDTIMPRAFIEYPWAMTPRPLEGDREWDGWPWRI